jgi:hypothetical protein
MTLPDLVAAAKQALAAGTNMTLVVPANVVFVMPPKFPRGELLCVNSRDERVYSYPPAKVLTWVSKLIEPNDKGREVQCQEQ